MKGKQANKLGFYTGRIILVLMVLALLLFVLSCKILPTITLKEECDEQKIEQHIKGCMPDIKNEQALIYYKKECDKEARNAYCKEVRYLIVRSREFKCAEAPKKYQKYCPNE